MPYFFRPFYWLGFHFLPEKIRKRVHIHTSPESLHDHFDRKTLPTPTQLGGTLGWDEAVDKHVVERILAENKPYEGTREKYLTCYIPSLLQILYYTFSEYWKKVSEV
jgi:hypothetical protein